MKEENGLSLYVHIPFCKRKCHYCDFLSAPADEETMERYAQALLCEIRAYRSSPLAMRQVKTIFFGGGTPSVLPATAIEFILEEIKTTFNISESTFKTLEITLEMNPGTVTEEKCRAYFDMGINRVSIGLQSFYEEELRLLGRIHDLKDFMSTYKSVRKAGFQNVNLDLMSALPGQTPASYAVGLEKALALEPEHISAYSLMIEKGTLFYDWFGEEKNDKITGDNAKTPILPPLPDEEAERKMYELTKSVTTKYGYERYEISNYAKKGHECQHNIVYWRRGDYLGLGLGASSLIGAERLSNLDDLETYMKYQMFSLNLPENKAKMKQLEMLSACQPQDFAGITSDFRTQCPRKELCKLKTEEEIEEFMFLGLRMTEGVSEQRFEQLFQRPLLQVYADVIDDLAAQGILRWTDHAEKGRFLSLTERGIDVSNRIFAQFLF